MNTIGPKSASGVRNRTQPLRAIPLCRLELSRTACNEIVSFINWIDLRLTGNRRLPEKIPKLRNLEQELPDVESLDGKPGSMLREATDEIQTALQKEDVEGIEHQTMSVRLNEIIAEFKTSHPTLYTVVNRMVDVLGQMGI